MSTKRKIKSMIKNVLVIFAIALMLSSCVFSGTTFADDESIMLTTERAGNYVSTFAINFYKNWSSVNYVYDENGAAYRSTGTAENVLEAGQQIYDNILLGNTAIPYIALSGRDAEQICNNKSYSEEHGMDCSTFVSAALWLAGYTEEFASTKNTYNLEDGCLDGSYVRNYGFEVYRTDRSGKVYQMDENGQQHELPGVSQIEMLQPGDVIVVNKPGRSNGHTNIVKEVKPDYSNKYLALDCGNSSNWQNVSHFNASGGGTNWDIWTPVNWDSAYGGTSEAFLIRATNGTKGVKKTGASRVATSYGEIKTGYDSNADEKTTPVDPADETYIFSNKSWIDFAFKNGLGLDDSKYYPTSNLSSSSSYYEEISSEKTTEDGLIDITELVNSGKILPGDILCSTHSLNGSAQPDYLLYVGGTKVIYAMPPYSEEGALKYEYLSTYFTKVKTALKRDIVQSLPESEKDNPDIELPAYGITKVYRLKNDLITSANIYENTGKLFFNGKGYYDPNTTYTGIPKKGAYEGIKKAYLFGIKSVADLFWFLVSLLTYLIRAVIVGWLNIFNGVIQLIVYQLNGETAKLPLVSKMAGIPPTASTENTLTVEGLLFNKIPIVDANFMNYESAGGHSLIDENGNHTALYTLRYYIAVLYTIIRNFSIAAMLFMLLYLGIRMAIATTAEKKADCKKMLISWVQGFVIVLFIHLFMYAVFYFNDALVGIIQKFMYAAATKILGATTTELSIYEAVRTKAYAFDIREGTAGIVFYIILIYLFLRFLLIYLKRAAAIYILGMSGSFMGFKYALDKASGKKSNSLQTWMKDFAFNVFLQSIHCLIYTIFMTVALSTAIKSITGLIVAIVILQFMIQADKIFMKIFGINAKGGLFEGVNKPDSYFTLLAKGKIITGGAKKTFGFVRDTIAGDNSVGMYFKMSRYANSGDDLKDAMKKVELAKYQKIGNMANVLQKLGNRLPVGILQRISQSEIQELYRLLAENSTYETKKKIYANIKKYKEMKKKHYTRNIVSAKNLSVGAFKTLAGVGLLVEGPAPALHSTIKGISTINKEMDRKKARHYKRTNPNGKYLPGDLGALQIKDEIAKEKFKKDKEKIEGKQAALKKLTMLESDLNQKIDDLNRLKAGKTATEIKDMYDHFEQTIKATKNSNISAAKISKAVNRYMNYNGLHTLKDSDFNGIVDEIQNVLDEKNSTNATNTIQLDPATRAQLRSAFGGNTLDGLDRKKASAFITENINKPNVIATGTLSNATDTNEINTLKEISDRLKDMYAINQKSKIENKGEANAYSKVLKEFKKRMEEVP